MGNRLFQEARKAVSLAAAAQPSHQDEAIATAENALSSAYANTTLAEKEQLRSFQDELNSLK